MTSALRPVDCPDCNQSCMPRQRGVAYRLPQHPCAKCDDPCAGSGALVEEADGEVRVTRPVADDQVALELGGDMRSCR